MTCILLEASYITKGIEILHEMCRCTICGILCIVEWWAVLGIQRMIEWWVILGILGMVKDVVWEIFACAGSKSFMLLDFYDQRHSI